MVGRLPIFMEDETGLEKFWRLSTALIPMPDFVEASGLDDLTDKGYRYQLARVNPDIGEMEVLLPAQEPLVNPVDAVVTVPNGRWKLSLEPLEGWRRSRSSVYFTSVLLIVCLLMAFLIYLILRQPVILRRHIDIRTRELAESNQLLQEEVKERVSAETALRTSEARVRAIVETAPNGIIILDNSFRVTSINSAALTMFDYGAGQIVGRDSTLLVPDCAELFGAGEPHVDSQGDDVRQFCQA
jgi:PAS domain-containing protein